MRRDRRIAIEYRQFVEDNWESVQAISELIMRHVVENKPGDPTDVYEWPQSEAAVIVAHWEEIEGLLPEAGTAGASGSVSSDGADSEPAGVRGNR